MLRRERPPEGFFTRQDDPDWRSGDGAYRYEYVTEDGFRVCRVTDPGGWLVFSPHHEQWRSGSCRNLAQAALHIERLRREHEATVSS